jgi:hypothetical protein
MMEVYCGRLVLRGRWLVRRRRRLQPLSVVQHLVRVLDVFDRGKRCVGPSFAQQITRPLRPPARPCATAARYCAIG